jgi:hypothetical protein
MNQQADNAWGVHALHIELPAASVRLTGLSARQRAELSGIYSGFITNSPVGIDQYSIVCNAYRLKGSPALSIEELTGDVAVFDETEAHINTALKRICEARGIMRYK